MRSVADQSVAELGGRFSVLSRQKRDHVLLDRLLGQLEGAPAGPEQDVVLRRIARLVFPHAFTEESVLWPVIRRVLREGEDLTLRVEQEHQEVNDLWTDLEATTDPAQRARLLARISDLLREDVRDEEDELLPRLQAELDLSRLRVLGVAWELVRRVAPTRPHPVVARRPPGNVLAALPLTVVDRSRDRLDQIAQRSGRLRSPAHRASRRLAGIAGRVERLDPLRRGERTATRR